MGSKTILRRDFVLIARQSEDGTLSSLFGVITRSMLAAVCRNFRIACRSHIQGLSRMFLGQLYRNVGKEILT